MSLAALSTIAAMNLEQALRADLPLERALEICEFALTLNRDSVEPYLAGIRLYEQHECMHDAGPWIDRALREHPQNIDVLLARVKAYRLEGQPDLALPVWNRITALDPLLDPLGAYTANLCLTIGSLDEAIERFRKIVDRIVREGRTDSDARVIFQQYGDALLRSGDPGGFLHFANILDSPHGAYYHVPGMRWWAGDDISGKRLFVTHQLGYGDQFLLTAIVPFLREQGCEIFITADPAVAELLAPVLGSDHVLACMRPFMRAATAPQELLDFRDRAQADLQATLYHLPLIAQRCGAQPNDLFVPYVMAPDEARMNLQEQFAEIRAQANGRMIVGLAWDCIQRSFPQEHGADASRYAHDRSIPTPFITSLTDDPEIAKHYYFVSLAHPAHYKFFPQEWPKNMDHLLQNKYVFSQTAALIEFCDFVMSVDTSVCNLACVQGQETWALLHHRVDWRFGLVGNTSPWLPTAKLFRQRVPGDWSGVMHSVRKAMLARTNDTTLQCVTGMIEPPKGAAVEYASGS